MAILRSIYLKGASQKLGGVVLYQSQGRTLARELAPSVSNPRTPSQMEQRVKLANVVSVYRANRTWMAGAFEDKKQKESDYNAFVSANLANSLVATSKSEAAAGAAIVAPYKVSSGSLPSVEHTLVDYYIQTNLFMGDLVIDENTTIGRLSQALIANNNNIRQGMQLSVIANLQLVSEANGIPYIITHAYELLINPESAALITDYVPGDILISAGDENHQLAIDTDVLGVGAACIILSETSGGKTRVSTQSLVMFGSNSIYTQYTSNAAWAAAIISYGESTENFLDSNSAYGRGYVEPTITIGNIEYMDQTYTTSSTFIGSLGAGEDVVLNLTSPVPELANVQGTYGLIGSPTRTDFASIAVQDDRTQVVCTLEDAVVVDEAGTCRFTLAIGDQVVNFDLRMQKDLS